MIKMIMHGCNGAMGCVIENLVNKMDDISIVAGIDPTNNNIHEYPVFTSLEKCNVKADVIVDFSSAKAIDRLLDYCSESHIPVVLCTTGLSKEQLEQVEKISAHTAILRSANMSLGINLLCKVLQDAAKALAEADFDIEIVEKHHNQKIDAPSGTALLLADTVNHVLDDVYHYQYDRSADQKKREKNEIGIHAIRGGTIVGEHDVIFAGTDEIITFSHTAYSKAVFAKGAIQAAKYLAGKQNGLYTMSDVIKNV